MTPKSMALAYRIYCYANPRGWDCTATEVGNAIGVDHRVVGRVAAEKGWGTRLRTSLRDSIGPKFYDPLDTLGDFNASRTLYRAGASE